MAEYFIPALNYNESIKKLKVLIMTLIFFFYIIRMSMPAKLKHKLPISKI